jgi:hypothetical protein
MRDLEHYQDNYEGIPFEKYQVKYRKQKVKDTLARYKHSSIVEVGCGLSSVMNDMEDFEKLQVIEPGKLFHEKAVKDSLSHSQKEKIFVVREYFELWKPESGLVPPDFIIISCLLHEVENAIALLEKAREISSKDTVIHINVPNARSFHRLLAVEMGLIKNIHEKSENQLKFQQYRIFDIEELSQLVKTANFEIIECGTFSFKPFTHKQMQNMIDAGLISEEMLDGFYKMEKYLPEVGSEIFMNIKKK